jgi:hypothetical protein
MGASPAKAKRRRRGLLIPGHSRKISSSGAKEPTGSLRKLIWRKLTGLSAK